MPLSTFSPPTFPEITQTQPSRRAFEQSDFPAAPVAGPSSQPYVTPPLGANCDFSSSFPTVIPNGWNPDQAIGHNFSGSGESSLLIWFIKDDNGCLSTFLPPRDYAN
jgi:hypothetical protein